MSTVKVGHDSEVFAERRGIGMFPMIGAVGGTKEHPLPVPGGVLSEDNVSIEMAIDPTSDLDEFLELTHQVMGEMDKKIKAIGATMVIESSVTFSENILNTFAPKSIEQGCDPDYNIYTRKTNDYPSLEESTSRHGSGHLHVDCAVAVDSPKAMARLIMLQDMFIKAPQWLLEGNVERNQVQGNLGNYRPKVYGAEYRSSSNIILKDDKILRHAFEQAQRTSKLATSGKGVSISHIDAVKEAMENNDKDRVRQYMKYYKAVEIPV